MTAQGLGFSAAAVRFRMLPACQVSVPNWSSRKAKPERDMLEGPQRHRWLDGKLVRASGARGLRTGFRVQGLGFRVQG